MLDLPLRAAKIHPNKDEPKKFDGSWLGINARTGETLFGTKKGVINAAPSNVYHERKDGTLS